MSVRLYANNRNTTYIYNWNKIMLNGYNHNSKSRNKLFKHFRNVYSIEKNLSCLNVFTVSNLNL